jgi:hypothetical protein
MSFSDNEAIRIKRSLHYLEQFCAKRKYKGYDPYDALNSKFPFSRLGKWPPILAIQVLKRNPFNFRPILAVPKMWNPKALGLFLRGYALLPKSEENKKKCIWLFEKLLELQSPVASGMAWGYPFPWASPDKYLPRWSPTSVVSGFVAQGIDAYYRTYGDNRALDALNKVCVFLSESLFHTEDEDLYAISYSTVKPDFCYNASLLAAEVYAATYEHTGQNAYADIARKALQSVLNRQKSDGSWNYSENLETGKQRVQIDFHQGFILDSILAIANSLNHFTEPVVKALQEGFEFYRTAQFTSDGRALWRLPGDFPADIHHQAQGILTATRIFDYDRNRRAEAMSKAVLKYTLDNFQDSRGYFYYRKHRYFTDRTNYMRWGNAWMFLSLCTVLSTFEKINRDDTVYGASLKESK